MTFIPTQTLCIKSGLHRNYYCRVTGRVDLDNRVEVKLEASGAFIWVYEKDLEATSGR